MCVRTPGGQRVMRLRNLTGAGLGGSAAIIKRLKGEKGEAKKWMEVKELVTALPPCDASVELNSWELELCGLSLSFFFTVYSSFYYYFFLFCFFFKFKSTENSTVGPKLFVGLVVFFSSCFLEKKKDAKSCC